MPNSRSKAELTFPSTSRLLRKKGFGHVMGQRYVANDCFKVLFTANRQVTGRLGVSASKKVLPAAVQRNCAKRVVREVFRQHDIRSKSLDIVVLIRRSFVEKTHLRVDKLSQLFTQVESKCGEL